MNNETHNLKLSTCFAGNTPVGEFVEHKGRKMLVVDNSTCKAGLDDWVGGLIDGICTSYVDDMRCLFIEMYEFNLDISDWDVSNVTNMSCMFAHATEFNQNIGTWDVSSVTDMSCMFNDAYAFNQDIGTWDVSNVENMGCMFWSAAAFNQPIGNWNLSSVKNKEDMFFGTTMETNDDDE